MLEKTVETYLVDRVRAAGGDAYKFTSPARVSVPDRIVVFPPARIYFVELKRPGGKLTRGQEREHERLRALGCDVRTLDSREAVDAFVREAGAAAAPADERAAFDVRSFEEWLDQQRDADVASVFHEIVARVTQLRAAASPSDDERAALIVNALDLARDTLVANGVDVPRVFEKITEAHAACANETGYAAALGRRLEFNRALAAPYGAEPTPGGHCERAGGCVCGGDLPRVREGCVEWVKP